MMKYLLIVGLIVYVVYKVLSFFFRAGAAAQQIKNFQEQQRKGFQNTNGQSSPKSTKQGKVNGGEYIDFEEIKK